MKDKQPANKPRPRSSGDDSETTQRTKRSVGQKRKSKPESKDNDLTVVSLLGACGSGVIFTMAKTLANSWNLSRMRNRVPDGTMPAPAAGLHPYALTAIAVILLAIPLLMLAVRLPRILRTMQGSKRHRLHWFLLQFAAWIMFGCLTIVFASEHQKVLDGGKGNWLGNALCSALNCIPAWFGFHLLLIPLMPDGFFERDYAGRKIMAFLGCRSVLAARIISPLGGLVLVAVSIGMNVFTIRSWLPHP